MIRVNHGSLELALKAALSAASKDDTRPHLYGVDFRVDGFELEKPRLRIAGTDGHRMVVTWIGWGMKEKAIDPSLVTRAEAERLLANLKTTRGNEVDAQRYDVDRPGAKMTIVVMPMRL